MEIESVGSYFSGKSHEFSSVFTEICLFYFNLQKSAIILPSASTPRKKLQLNVLEIHKVTAIYGNVFTKQLICVCTACVREFLMFQ